MNEVYIGKQAGRIAFGVECPRVVYWTDIVSLWNETARACMEFLPAPRVVRSIDLELRIWLFRTGNLPELRIPLS